MGLMCEPALKLACGTIRCIDELREHFFAKIRKRAKNVPIVEVLEAGFLTASKAAAFCTIRLVGSPLVLHVGLLRKLNDEGFRGRMRTGRGRDYTTLVKQGHELLNRYQLHTSSVFRSTTYSDDFDVHISSISISVRFNQNDALPKFRGFYLMDTCMDDGQVIQAPLCSTTGWTGTVDFKPDQKDFDQCANWDVEVIPAIGYFGRPFSGF